MLLIHTLSRDLMAQYARIPETDGQVMHEMPRGEPYRMREVHPPLIECPQLVVRILDYVTAVECKVGDVLRPLLC